MWKILLSVSSTHQTQVALSPAMPLSVSCLFSHMQKRILQNGSTGPRQTSHHPTMEHIQVLKHRLCPSNYLRAILEDSKHIVWAFSEHITHSIASGFRSVDGWPLLDSLTPAK